MSFALRRTFKDLKDRQFEAGKQFRLDERFGRGKDLNYGRAAIDGHQLGDRVDEPDNLAAMREPIADLFFDLPRLDPTRR